MADLFQQRVYGIVADVLGVPMEALDDEASPDTLRQWDSLSHLNLVVALEKAFDIALTDDDVVEMLSVSLIQTILIERGANVASQNDLLR